ncbi:PAS domain S-box protein [Mucilaginibacter psychrotolerans]|uniref:histidine kinase n=1 Tax=Mucilaginibacter psychrotolerans TaxID=1524096 RepID=A0A4Y8SAZ1_9SPHI|nr:PAS domain S-box protein [Mucilaginibacter psychrotolerans]TFF35780.1 PAS domain S-box protein [Mucilaginibacter psychrotolerans]
MPRLKILHLESVAADAAAVRFALSEAGLDFDKAGVCNRDAYIHQLANFSPDIVLAAYSSCDINCLEGLNLLKQAAPGVPMILLVQPAQEQLAIDALQQGVADYLLKGSLGRLPHAIANALQKAKLEACNAQLTQKVNSIESFIGTAELIAGTGSLQIDLVTQERRWSAGMYRILGYSPGQVTASLELFTRHLHPEDVGILPKMFDDAIGTQDNVEFKFRIVAVDGTVKYLYSKIIVTRDEGGSPQMVTGFIQDISKLELSQQQLTQANYELNRILGTIDEVIFARDIINSRQIHISAACEKIFGYKPEAFMADPTLWHSILHPDNATMRADNFVELLQGKAVSVRYKIMHKHLGSRWVETRVVPTLNSQGILARVDGVTRDITGQIKIEEDLKASELRLRLLIENSNEIISVASVDDKVLFISDNVSRILGYTANEFKLRRFTQGYIHPADQQMHDEIVAKTKASPGEIQPFTWRVMHADGHWVWVAGKVTNLLHLPPINGIVANYRDVTGHKAADEKLVLSEQRYRNIVETAQEGIWMIDENMVTVFVNKKMCDMIGYSPEEILGRHNYDFKEKNEREATIKRIRSRAPGVVQTHESVFITKSGKRIICRVSINGVFDQHGCYKATLGMVTDITEYKAQQDALKKSEANLLAIIENTSDLVYSLDRELNFITFNQQFSQTIKQVYGIQVTQGSNSLELLAGFDAQVAEKWKVIYNKALDGIPQQFVNEYPAGTEKVYLSYSVNPIWESGEVIGLSCFSRDITRQKADELALVQSEANLRSVFENTDLGIILYDQNLRIVSYNKIAAGQTRYILGKVPKLGKNTFDYFPKKRWPEVKQIIARVMAHETVCYEVAYDLPKGGQAWVEARWFGVTNKQKQVVGIILTLKDINDRKHAELEREKMTADLIRRNQELEQFTYIISHNLRAPVANIMGLSALLDTETVPGQDTETLHALSSSVDHLDKVILDLNQIMEVNKQLGENKELINLTSLVDEIKEELTLDIQKYHAVITCGFNNAPGLFTVRSYLYSIFQNLITNSIKYRKIDIAPQIQIVSFIADNQITISFTDNCIGIDTKRYGTELFGLYKRFSFNVEGKGMGLFMVKKQVESLGGTISVESEPGNGAKFVVQLPV